NAHPNIVPYQLFPASDGHLIIACGNDRQFAALCRVLDLAELSQAPDYATNPARVANRARLVPVLAGATARMTRADLIAALEGAGVPGGPVNDVAEALADPQVAARGLMIAPEGIAGLRSPLRFSRSPLVSERAAPALGEGEWGFS
ncbi:MAG TPA: CoA transferase, partial [Paracoccus sp. (in: a-proteobacteria)]|nr:CoA transferase [Paracoccus sp. (in: a-proteobacteria)]